MAALALPIVLASASPRRRELLANVGVAVRVAPVDADETRRAGEAPEAYVQRVCREKLALSLAGPGDEDAVVITADTTVADGDAVLGKPTSDDDARAILARLSGRTHRVCTAVAIGRRGAGLLASTLVTTRVTFRALDPATIDAYVATGEGRDKAGSYAIQGLGSGFVVAIEGSYTNVVGLPVVETLAMLAQVGALGAWP